MSVNRVNCLAVSAVCVAAISANVWAEELPGDPPFPHPACAELLVGPTTGGPVTDVVFLDACAEWAAYMPEAEWDGDSKEHFYYREDSSDGLPGGYAGYIVEDVNPNGAYVIKTWDNAGGIGYHTALLVAASEFGIVTAPYTRKFGYRCNGELKRSWANDDETYGVEIAATPQAILNAADLNPGVAQLVFDDYVPDCSSCCIGHLLGTLDPETDTLTYTGFTLDPDLISPVLCDVPPAEMAFMALAEIFGSAELTWQNLEDAIRAIDLTGFE